MSTDEKLLKSAFKLVKVMDKAADSNLPKEIVDVVKLHSKMAVGSAWIPIPGVDIAAGAASIWGMYARINGKIGLPFGENVMKSIASGVATNLASYLAMSGVASALKFIPGIGTLGGAAIMSVGMYALTLTSGYVYMKALISLKENDQTITASSISSAVSSALNDKSDIKGFMDDAKKSYKK